jgi:hypothetical protein
LVCSFFPIRLQSCIGIGLELLDLRTHGLLLFEIEVKNFERARLRIKWRFSGSIFHATCCVGGFWTGACLLAYFLFVSLVEGLLQVDARVDLLYGIEWSTFCCLEWEPRNARSRIEP